jgi:Putative Flp pilus-assembly TadE/G-like
MVIGATGLATDTIQWALWKRELQRAADSAAIAGVYERNMTALGAVDGVQAAVLRDLTLNQHVGTLDGAPALAFPEDTTAPDKRSNQVSVELKFKKSLTFSSMFLKNPPIITAKATAASVPGAGEYCVIALDGSDVTGGDIGGSTHVDLGKCCLIANAAHPNEAFKNTGDGSTVKAGCIAAVGGVKHSDSENWEVDNYFPYSEPAADPFEHVEVPDESECTVANTIVLGPHVDDLDRSEVDSGIVCITGGFAIKGELKLGPATYVINTSGASDDLSMTESGASLTCTGCTIILTNFADPTQTGNFSLTGGAVNITAPTAAGMYQGVALYQDRLAEDDGKKGANHVRGNDSAGIQGVIYTPGRSLLYNGGGSAEQVETCMQIVALRVAFSGNSKIKMGSACASAGLKGHTGGGWLVRLVA